MDATQVCIQFTGGKDSTLLAALMAREFAQVHLLTFRNPLIVNLELVSVNVGKLKQLYSEDKFQHQLLDNEALLRELYTGQWLRDLKKYNSYAANNVCSSCRLAMIAHTIRYCRQKGIREVRDGANRTGFDLSQQPWSLELIRQFYQEYGIHYDCQLLQASRNDIDLLKLGLEAQPPLYFYRSQPLCKGGGEIHNIYFRCYFLPRYGRQGRQQRDIEWLHDKLERCREYIAAGEVI
ncbi:MAG: hypothetical protein ACK2UW_04460 [Anaerolineales bacterium]